MTIDENLTVNSTELAIVLGVTARRVRQLAQDGIIETVNRGQYQLCDSVQRYAAFLCKEPLSKEDKKLDSDRRKAEVSLKASKAKIAELEAAELEGKMHRSEDVEAMTTDLIYAIRGALMALPGRLAVDVCDVQTPAEASELIRKEVHAIMRDLSQYRYDPQKYEERVRGRLNWGEIPEIQDE